MFLTLSKFAESTCEINGAACTPAQGKIALGLVLGILSIVFVSFVFWVITLIHLIKHDDVPNRTLWLILHFVGLQLLAGPIYYFVVKRQYDTAHVGSKPIEKSAVPTPPSSDGPVKG